MPTGSGPLDNPPPRNLAFLALTGVAVAAYLVGCLVLAAIHAAASM
jgi:hypothetical protein